MFSPCLSVSLCEGDVLFQMAEVHRQIQVQLEEMVGILSLNGFCVCDFYFIFLNNDLLYSNYIQIEQGAVTIPT